MTIEVSLTVNGRPVQVATTPRTSLADLLREQLHLTGTHLGCEHGVCGACTVFVDDVPVRSCLTLAASCEGVAVVTVEGLEGPEADAVREAFSTEHALQCGFCTPGMLMTARALLDRNPDPSEEEIREAISGQICRCTGYSSIVRSVRWAAEHEAADAPQPQPVPAGGAE